MECRIVTLFIIVIAVDHVMPIVVDVVAVEPRNLWKGNEEAIA